MEDAVLELGKLGRDEAFAIGDGLLANVVAGNRLELRFADLDVVPEYPGELDLQRADPRPFAFAALEVEKDILRTRRQRSKFVELLDVTVRKDPALAIDRRRLRHQRTVEKRGDIFAQIDVAQFAQRVVELEGRARTQQLPECLCALKTVPNHAEVSRRRETDGGSDRQPLHVADFGQHRPGLRAKRSIQHEELDRVVPTTDSLDVGERFEEARPQCTRAHRGFGVVEKGEAASLVRSPSSVRTSSRLRTAASSSTNRSPAR